jgi:hypothetical protein
LFQGGCLLNELLVKLFDLLRLFLLPTHPQLQFSNQCISVIKFELSLLETLALLCTSRLQPVDASTQIASQGTNGCGKTGITVDFKRLTALRQGRLMLVHQLSELIARERDLFISILCLAQFGLEFLTDALTLQHVALSVL